MTWIAPYATPLFALMALLIFAAFVGVIWWGVTQYRGIFSPGWGGYRPRRRREGER